MSERVGGCRGQQGLQQQQHSTAAHSGRGPAAPLAKQACRLVDAPCCPAQPHPFPGRTRQALKVNAGVLAHLGQLLGGDHVVHLAAAVGGEWVGWVEGRYLVVGMWVASPQASGSGKGGRVAGTQARVLSPSSTQLLLPRPWNPLHQPLY